MTFDATVAAFMANERPMPRVKESLSPLTDAVRDNAFARLAAEHAKFRAQLRLIEKGA